MMTKRQIVEGLMMGGKPLNAALAAAGMAGEEGFEPSLTDSESAVLPLDDSPACQNYSIW